MKKLNKVTHHEDIHDTSEEINEEPHWEVVDSLGSTNRYHWSDFHNYLDRLRNQYPIDCTRGSKPHLLFDWKVIQLSHSVGAKVIGHHQLPGDQQHRPAVFISFPDNYSIESEAEIVEIVDRTVFNMTGATILSSSFESLSSDDNFLGALEYAKHKMRLIKNKK